MKQIEEPCLKVCDRACDQCLFGPNKIVSDERKAAVLAECARKDSFFVCHKGSIAGQVVVCRGFYEVHGQDNQSIQIAGRLGGIRMVDPEALGGPKKRRGGISDAGNVGAGHQRRRG